VTSFQEDATPTWGLLQSSSVMPTARNMARAGARWKPSVTSPLRGFMGLGGLDPVSAMARAYGLAGF
jgi:hypothetical protein